MKYTAQKVIRGVPDEVHFALIDLGEQLFDSDQANDMYARAIDAATGQLNQDDAKISVRKSVVNAFAQEIKTRLAPPLHVQVNDFHNTIGLNEKVIAHG